jgi:NitT/TauT family transport system ATP-binding protein
MIAPSGASAEAPLLTVEQVSKAFPLAEGHGMFPVLENVSFSVKGGEVIAVLGRSGSGKSTLLRILGGLIPPTDGRVLSRGAPLHGPNHDTAMVFQSFALLPWLTVLDNVEVGLKARGVPAEERHKRALAAIDLVGLHGFEGAYPKELSGGMQQRVGFARMFVVRPPVALMDEPFSALDVLTAEKLREDISALWQAGTFPARSMVLVTHNIEEAVLLADRVLLLGSNPGRLRCEIPIGLARPRDRDQDQVKAIVADIYVLMTHPDANVGPVVAEERAEIARFHPLPHARAVGIEGLLELVLDHGGSIDLPGLAQRLQLGERDLLPIVDAAVLLDLVHVHEGQVTVTERGRAFTEGKAAGSRAVFQEQVLAHAPLVALIVNALHETRAGSVRKGFVLDVLEEHFPPPEAERQFDTAVDWGRYAGLFDYDTHDEQLSLPASQPNPAP